MNLKVGFQVHLNLINLKKKNLLECIYCNSKNISKSIMAPSISVVKGKRVEIKNVDKLKHEKKQINKDKRIY